MKDIWEKLRANKNGRGTFEKFKGANVGKFNKTDNFTGHLYNFSKFWGWGTEAIAHPQYKVAWASTIIEIYKIFLTPQVFWHEFKFTTVLTVKYGILKDSKPLFSLKTKGYTSKTDDR